MLILQILPYMISVVSTPFPERIAMATAIKTEIQNGISPYSEALCQVVFDAWSQWQEMPDMAKFRFPRTRANIVFEFIATEATRIFTEDKRIHIIKKNETLSFLLDKKFLFRFKKGDENGLSSNIPTFAAMAFNDPQEELLELPNVQRVDIVYVLNKLETAVSRITVVARDGDRLAWSYDLYDCNKAGDVVLLPVASPQVAPSADGVIRILGDEIKEKKDAK
jgi:hypothetical protein